MAKFVVDRSLVDELKDLILAYYSVETTNVNNDPVSDQMRLVHASVKTIEHAQFGKWTPYMMIVTYLTIAARYPKVAGSILEALPKEMHELIEPMSTAITECYDELDIV